MHEDASVDEAVLAGAGRVFAIASAGDTALRLAHRDRRVTAVDVHPAQVAYVRARAAGDAAGFGSVERLLDIARLAGRLAGWNQEQLRRFLLLDDPQSQARAFDQLLRTRRCRALLAAGLHPVVLRLGYAAPFVSVLPQPFARSLARRLRAGFATHSNRHNPYAWRLLLGVDPPGHQDPPSRPAPGLVVELGEAAGFLERQPAGSSDGFTLSNILDGPDRQYRRRLAAAAQHAGRAGAPVVLRTLRDARNQDEASRALRDRALLWGAIIVAAAEDLIDHVDWS
jgi:S-adenosylmethionine:diacylglycerol 3-amino-3-carboxypropyl transferase